uniref:hypothetical protein n=1 Tax=Streptomyces sp. NRRL F-6674 TaxID=1463877 RepID=UPI001F344624
NRSGEWGIDTEGLGKPGDENLELAQLVVENPGRTAITVYTPSLAIMGTDKPDYTICPRFFELKEFGADSSTSETSVRIDPYDRVTFLLDLWSVIPRVLREANGGNVQIRGCVLVAGRAKPCKSPKRRAWKVTPETWTFRKDLTSISPFTVIWRELFKANAKRGSDDSEEDPFPDYRLGVTIRTAMQKFPERPDAHDFVDALRQADRQGEASSFGYAQLIMSMDESLDRHEKHLSAWAFHPTGQRNGDSETRA